MSAAVLAAAVIPSAVFVVVAVAGAAAAVAAAAAETGAMPALLPVVVAPRGDAIHRPVALFRRLCVSLPATLVQSFLILQSFRRVGPFELSFDVFFLGG